MATKTYTKRVEPGRLSDELMAAGVPRGVSLSFAEPDALTVHWDTTPVATVDAVVAAHNPDAETAARTDASLALTDLTNARSAANASSTLAALRTDTLSFMDAQMRVNRWLLKRFGVT